MKREPTIWENVFTNDTLDKGLKPMFKTNIVSSLHPLL